MKRRESDQPRNLRIRESLMTETLEYSVDSLYDSSMIIEGLAGTTFAFAEIIRAGVTAAHLTLAAHAEGLWPALERVKDYYAAIQANPEDLMLIRCADDIKYAKKTGKLGLIFGFQSSSPIEADLTNLGIFASLGIRIIQLTYMGRNFSGDGCYEEPDMGLTYFGKMIIREMNRLGILVDISHSGWKTASDALVVSTEPIILSHSNPFFLNSNRRNVPDEILQGVAEKDGVIGINAHPALCSLSEDVQPTIDDYLDIFEYTIELVGIDHVGIGADLFEGFKAWQAFRWDARYDELDNPWGTTLGVAKEEDLRAIAHGLAARGYSNEALEKVLGGNFLRVFEAVWVNDPIHVK